MSSDVLTQALAANQVATFGAGRIFNLLNAIAPVSVVAEFKATKPGQSSKHKVFNSIPAGSKFVGDAADGVWQYLRVTNGPTPQTLTLYIGDDDMSFNQAVTLVGTALVSVAPSATLADQASIATVTGQHALFAANLARRRMTIYADPTNTAVVFLRTTGGANDIGFITAGSFEEFDGTWGLDYRDASAGGQKLYRFEES